MEIMQGAESFSITNPSNIGVLLIHGFSGSPFEMSKLADGLSKSGFNIECPRLNGHGTQWKDLNRVKYTDWLRDVDYALRNLKDRAKSVYVVGFSLGGALALYLAENHPEIKGIFLINHALFFRGILSFFIFFLRFFIPYKMKSKSKKNRRSMKDRSIVLVNYDRVPTKGAYQMKKLTAFVKRRLKKVEQPVLIFKSRMDSQPLKNVSYTLGKIKSRIKETVWLEDSYHVAPMDFDRNLIVSKIADFIFSREG